ncbi:MAG: dipeptidase [Erysipelotrichaceae bacterium]
MKIIDLHCDTLTKMMDTNQHLIHNQLHIDLEKMKIGQSKLQVFAIFTDLKNTDDPNAFVYQVIDFFDSEMKANKHLIQAVKTSDEINQSDKMIALLSLEEGDVIKDDLNQLDKLYQHGVRMIAPLWNYKNSIGTPAVINQNECLTDFGIQYIKKMEALGIIIDVSHLNDAGIRDVLAYTNKPIIASHSNARALCDVPRNLPDELIIAIAQRGGVIGINYFDKFLNGSSIKNMILHMKHIVKIAGIDVLALGSDFDGITCELELKDTSYLPLLIDALKLHFTKEEVEKILYKNTMRVFNECLN